MNGKIMKKRLPEGNPCDGCGAVCCHDLAIQIQRPVTKQEIIDLKWQLHFDTVRVYISNRRWHLLIKGRCMYLDENDHCTIYDLRSERCREHDPKVCERYAGEPYWDVMMETPDDLDVYLKKGKKNVRR